jgi:hypothetical protein
VEPGDHRRGGRGKRGSTSALAQPRHPHQRGVACHHEHGGGDGEGQQPAQQNRFGADAVGQGTEHRLEQHLGAVIDGQQDAQRQQ